MWKIDGMDLFVIGKHGILRLDNLEIGLLDFFGIEDD